MSGDRGLPRSRRFRYRPIPAMNLVGPRLGENVDAAIAQLVVLRREWVCIDPNLANSVFWRQITAAESINVDGATIRSGGRPGEGLEVRRQVVRIVGERIEVRSAQH